MPMPHGRRFRLRVLTMPPLPPQLIEEWNSAARAWEAGQSAQSFGGMDLAACAGAGACTALLETSAEFLPDLGSQAADTPVEWNPLFYSGLLLWPVGGSTPGPSDPYGSGAGTTISVTRGDEQVFKSVAESCRTLILAVRPCPDSCSDSRSSRRRSNSNSCTTCASKCYNNGGMWDGTSCKVTMQLKTVRGAY
jgi:hypothetical protein